MSQQFDRKDLNVVRIQDPVIFASTTPSINIINVVGSNRTEEFCNPTSVSSAINYPYLSPAMTYSSSATTFCVNTSNNHREESFGFKKSTTISLQCNSSAVIPKSTNASTQFSTAVITSNSIANPEVVNASISTSNRNEIINIHQLPSSALSFTNLLISPSPSQIASTDDVIWNQETMVKNTKAATNVHANLSPLLTSSGSSTFSTIRCWKRQNYGRCQSSKHSKRFDGKRPENLSHVESKIFRTNSEMQQPLIPNQLQQQQQQQQLTDFISTSFPTKSCINDIHKSEISNIMLSDATYLNDYTSIEDEFGYDPFLCNTIGLFPTTDSSVTAIVSYFFV